jgi:hypothetical protein
MWGAPLKIKNTDLAVGNPEFVKLALKELGVSIPQPPDYPKCLENYLFRKVWKSTLGDISAEFSKDPTATFFVKPAGSAKAFDGMILNGIDEATMWIQIWRETNPASFPVMCSEIVEFLKEYRVYTVNGEVRGVSKYGKEGPEDA